LRAASYGTSPHRLPRPPLWNAKPVVNYDNCVVSLELGDGYLAALKRVWERHFADVTRYTTSAFLRMKQGSALQQHDAMPHIDESESKALQKWM